MATHARDRHPSTNHLPSSRRRNLLRRDHLPETPVPANHSMALQSTSRSRRFRRPTPQRDSDELRELPVLMSCDVWFGSVELIVSNIASDLTKTTCDSSPNLSEVQNSVEKSEMLESRLETGRAVRLARWQQPQGATPTISYCHSSTLASELLRHTGHFTQSRNGTEKLCRVEVFVGLANWLRGFSKKLSSHRKEGHLGLGNSLFGRQLVIS